MHMAKKESAAAPQPNDGPLSGVRIIDLTSVGMGPYATQILGDMGADIIKIEAPEGDVFRHAEPARNPGMGTVYLNLNRNKRSVTLDLKLGPDLAMMRDLLRDADVFISNVRPRALAKLGLDYDTLRHANPRLIYCAAVGFGQAGPYAAKPAFDDVIQAMSGLAALQGVNSEAGPAYINTILGDKISGLTLAYSIPMALYEREKSGLGQAIEVPMFETLVSFTLVEHLCGETYQPPLGGMGYGRVLSPNRRPYRTSDGYISLLPYTDGQWQRFFTLAGRPDLAQDQQYASARARSRNFDTLYQTLGDIVATRTTQQWMDLLENADIPMAPVHQLTDVLNDPHLAATGFFQRFEHPTEGNIRLMGIPVKFSRTPGKIRRLPPRQNADREQVQAELYGQPVKNN
jgi:crotonobetainyl-CoA:carnitine CoA-transferase CaiB-like acyl-CoA transferase